MGERWVIAVLFLILPFALIAPGLIWKAQQLFFLTMPLFIVAFAIKNLWVRSFLVYAGLWQVFLFIYAFNRPGANPGPGLSFIISIMAGAIVYYFVSRSTLPREKWFTVIRIAVIMQILISIPQFFGFSPVAEFMGLFIKIKQLQPSHLVGSIGNRNYLAAFIAFALPMFLMWRHGWRWVFLPLIAFMLVFCPSPGSLAAIMGAILFLSWGKPSRRIALNMLCGVVGCAGFTAAYVLTTGNHLWEFQALPGQLAQLLGSGKVEFDVFQGDLGRFGMWIMAFGHLVQSVPGMILGFGPGAFWGREYPLHSEYMAVWFYFGLVGLFLMLGYIVSTWKMLWLKKERVLLASFLIILVEIGANHSFEIATTAMLGVIILGLIERERING